jgi:hypothetical protein
MQALVAPVFTTHDEAVSADPCAIFLRRARAAVVASQPAPAPRRIIFQLPSRKSRARPSYEWLRATVTAKVRGRR